MISMPHLQLVVFFLGLGVLMSFAGYYLAMLRIDDLDRRIDLELEKRMHEVRL